MDTAKIVSVMGISGGRVRDYAAPVDNRDAGLPVIAIPTTAGTGSEATRVTIITETITDEKLLCIGRAFMPAAALIDYEMTLTMPFRLTADTGIDSITHAMEAYVSRKANPFSDAMSLAAMHSAESRYADCARQMGMVPAGTHDVVANRILIEELQRLNEDLRVPSPMEYGIDYQQYTDLMPAMAEQALASGSPANNPVIPDRDQIVELYKSVYASSTTVAPVQFLSCVSAV
jgi:alcohol dehydrogenase class IV